MKIFILTVGKLKKQFWAEACDEYMKRLSSYTQLEIIEVADASAKKLGGIKQALATEETLIIKSLKKIPNNSRKILLDIKGKETSSEYLAEKISNIQISGINNIIFIIGASNGVSPKINELVNESISFGPITLPHNLARVVLLEQIYRAFKILNNEPYHK